MSPEIESLYRQAYDAFSEAIEEYRAHERDYGSDQSVMIAECRASMAAVLRTCPSLATEIRGSQRVLGIRRS